MFQFARGWLVDVRPTTMKSLIERAAAAAAAVVGDEGGNLRIKEERKRGHVMRERR